MDDLISRQAALDAFGLSEKSRKFGGDHSGYETLMLYEIQDVLEDLPAVELKRKTGEWLPIAKRLFGHSVIWDYCCSECKEKAYKDKNGNYSLTNFCPNCGAEMGILENE